MVCGAGARAPWSPWPCWRVLPAAAGAGQPQTPEASSPARPSPPAAARSRPSRGPVDDEAFFNYTDYEHNALRVARVRLMGEWRIAPRFSILGEARTENGDGVQVPAFYGRWQPWAQPDLTLQAGVIPPVIGAYPRRRAYGRDNPSSALRSRYQYFTSLRPDALPATADDC